MAKQEKSKAEQYREERKARLQKAAKRNKKKPISPDTSKKIGKAVGIIVIIAIVAAIGAFAVNYTGVIEKNTTAITVGEEKISQAEYGYYYNQGYNMAQQYASYGYDIGFDTSALPDQQEYRRSDPDVARFLQVLCTKLPQADQVRCCRSAKAGAFAR